MNSFIAICNQNGIACASDSDNTIFQISKKAPIALAVCTSSPVPWKEIITQYIRKGEPIGHKTLEEYARDFEAFLHNYPADKAWNKLGIDELNIILLGYGEDEIYPSVCDIQIEVDEETEKMRFRAVRTKQVTISKTSVLPYIGNWENLSAIIQGSSSKVQTAIIDKEQVIYKSYVQRVKAKFKDTKYEDYVNQNLERAEKTVFVSSIVKSAKNSAVQENYLGISTFSAAELVDSVEKFVNANVRLSHLKNGGRGLVGQTKEIAVLTFAEGFTWIKHSVFAI